MPTHAPPATTALSLGFRLYGVLHPSPFSSGTWIASSHLLDVISRPELSELERKSAISIKLVWQNLLKKSNILSVSWTLCRYPHVGSSSGFVAFKVQAQCQNDRDLEIMKSMRISSRTKAQWNHLCPKMVATNTVTTENDKFCQIHEKDSNQTNMA